MKNPLQYYKGDKIFWFRLFGKGLKFSKQEMLFSERNGLTKYWMVFGWRVTILEKQKTLKDYPITDEQEKVLQIDSSERYYIVIIDGFMYTLSGCMIKYAINSYLKKCEDSKISASAIKMIDGIEIAKFKISQLRQDNNKIYFGDTGTYIEEYMGQLRVVKPNGDVIDL